MSEVLKRLDVVAARLDQVTAELHTTNEAMRLSGQQQQVILDVLVRQTDTNTAMLRKLAEHDTRLGNLENPGPKSAA